MTAEIVAVGTEILLGGLVDTNTTWLSRRLADLGVAVHRHTTVGHDKGRLDALSEAASRADLVVSTGGLGPTPDDLTHEASGRATGRGLVEYPGRGGMWTRRSGASPAESRPPRSTSRPSSPRAPGSLPTPRAP